MALGIGGIMCSRPFLASFFGARSYSDNPNQKSLVSGEQLLYARALRMRLKCASGGEVLEYVLARGEHIADAGIGNRCFSL